MSKVILTNSLYFRSEKLKFSELEELNLSGMLLRVVIKSNSLIKLFVGGKHMRHQKIFQKLKLPDFNINKQQNLDLPLQYHTTNNAYQLWLHHEYEE